jgi:transposase
MHYVGIDVSKAKLDCCWLRDVEKSKVKTKTFQNTLQGHDALSAWLTDQTKASPAEIQIVIEATGIYHESLAYALFEAGFQVCVANPARTKEFSNSLGSVHKTDAKDSMMLAQYSLRMQPERWQPEAKEIRELKALIARLEALEADLQRETNRLEKAEFTRTSDLVIESLTLMISQLKAEKQRLEKEIDDHIDRHPQLKKDRELMASIPGVGAVISRIMLSLIHSRSFTQARQVSAFVGLVPRIQESGQWKGRSRLSKQGPSRIRAKLYMAAIVCAQWNPDIKAQYQRLLANGKSKMQALGAAMRKLVQICFGVVKHQSQYRPQVAV